MLHCARRAVPTGFRTEHGTTMGRRDYLLRSKKTNRGMGRLNPDVLVLGGHRAMAVIDAKYEPVRYTNTCKKRGNHFSDRPPLRPKRAGQR